MRALRERIQESGVGIGSDIVKVDMFLNHRLDTGLLFQMGEALAAHFKEKSPDIILTVESSGIALALCAAHFLGDIPVVFAKKAQAVNQAPGMLEAMAFSFTHKKEYVMRADARYLPKGAKVLIVDDFLADGEAVRGMRALLKLAECKLIGVGIGIEKGFQPGGKNLRAEGLDIMSLAVVAGIESGKLILADTDEE